MTKFLLCCCLMLAPTLATAEVVKDSDTPEEIILVVYPEGTALVREKRLATVIHGSNKILIRNIPRKVDEGSILLQVTSPLHSAQFTEYSFQSDQITRQSLLTGSVGLDVQLLPTGGNLPSQSVRLLAVDGDEVIVETGKGIQAVDSNLIAFHRIPYRLTQHPLMTVKLYSDMAKPLEYEVSYLAHGLSWDSSYTIIVAEDASKIDINNWIHIHNATGVQFTKAAVRIAEGKREEDSVMYTLGRPITLPDLSSKNVEWFTAHHIPTTKNYRLYSTSEVQNDEAGMVMKPQAEVWLSVKNEESSGLGQSLPAGVIKVFQTNPQGRLGYLGENKTAAITKGEHFSLKLGKSPDLTAEMMQTDFRRLSNQVVESGYNLTLTNQKDTPLDVSFIQSFKGEWSILRETHDHQDVSSDAIEWKLSLPAEGTETLRFRVRMKE